MVSVPWWCVLWLCLLVCFDDWAFKVRRQPAVVQPSDSSSAMSDGVPGTSAHAELPPPAASLKPEDFYVVMYGSTTCGPCRNWETTQLPLLKKAGVGVTVVHCDRDPQWLKDRRLTHPDTGQQVVLPRVTRYPTFEIVRRRDSWPMKRFVGSTTADAMLRQVKQLHDLASSQ